MTRLILGRTAAVLAAAAAESAFAASTLKGPKTLVWSPDRALHLTRSAHASAH